MPAKAEDTYAVISNGYCYIRTYQTRYDADIEAWDWNAIYGDIHHYAEPKRFAFVWVIAIYDGYRLGESPVIAFANGV